MGVLKEFAKRTPLAKPYILTKGLFARPVAQNDETEILRRLLSRFDIPKTFIEFGFGGWEFNCASIVDEWEGLLLDGDLYNVVVANTILPRKVRALWQWLTLDSLGNIHEYAAGRDLGILSIDVDGNDYWFLRALIDLRPALVIVEYNAAFGLRPLSVPYDPRFDRWEKHESGLYCGASLAAMAHLCGGNGYSLLEVGESGVNAFFVRNDLLGASDVPLLPQCAYREKAGTSAAEQWDEIKHLPFVDVTSL